VPGKYLSDASPSNQIKANQSKSKQIKANQSKSKQIKAKQIKHDTHIHRDNRQESKRLFSI
jgi:hypothetical protein